MKAGLVGAATLGLVSLALAQPHPIRHVHKRDTVVHTVTDVVTVEKEEIVVYMDDENRPVATSTFYVGMAETPAPSPAPAPASSPSSVAAAFHQIETSIAAAAPAPPKPSAPAPAPSPNSSPAAAPAPSSQSSASSGSGSGSSSGQSNGSGSPGSTSAGQGFKRGLSYSPYQANHACKSADQIKSDLANTGEFDVVRLYGTDCNQVANTIQALSGTNKQILAGVFDVNNWQKEAQVVVDAVKNQAGGNWNVIHTVSIGNEAVNSGTASVGAVTSAVSSARTFLRSAGFKGNVVTIDTMVAHKNNPTLSSTSDFLGMNCHAFFDGNTLPQDAGKFVQGWVDQLKGAANGKPIIVTESGWPWKGTANKKAVPSVQNQQAAISSLKSAFGSNMVIFTAMDDMWKQNNANTYNAENFWGVLSHNQ